MDSEAMNVASESRVRVSVCESCVWTEAWGEPLPDFDGDALALSRLEGYVLAPLPCEHGEDCNGCDSPSSSAFFGRSCDGCGTCLAGSRYEYWAVRLP